MSPSTDVGAEWATEFPPPCTQNELSYCDETSIGFLTALQEQGYPVSFNRGNGSSRAKDFRDESFGGGDGEGADSVRILHFSSHGSLGADGVFRGYLGGPDGGCSWRSDEARYGDGRLTFLFLDACHSIEVSAAPNQTWGNAFQGLHMICGFTGTVSDSWWSAGRGYSTGSRIAAGDGIAEAWLDEGYAPWLDDHPVVMAAGRSADEALWRLDSETLESDPEGIANAEIHAFRWKWRS